MEKWRNGELGELGEFHLDESKFIIGYGDKSRRDTMHTASNEVSNMQPHLWCGDVFLHEQQEVYAFSLPKTAVNTDVLIEIVDAYLTESPCVENVWRMCGDDDFVFQHDYAPAHGAQKSEKFLEERNIATLPLPQLTRPKYFNNRICPAENESSGKKGPPTNVPTNNE